MAHGLDIHATFAKVGDALTPPWDTRASAAAPLVYRRYQIPGWTYRAGLRPRQIERLRMAQMTNASGVMYDKRSNPQRSRDATITVRGNELQATVPSSHRGKLGTRKCPYSYQAPTPNVLLQKMPLPMNDLEARDAYKSS